jgi:hypothetical protein
LITPVKGKGIDIVSDQGTDYKNIFGIFYLICPTASTILGAVFDNSVWQLRFRFLSPFKPKSIHAFAWVLTKRHGVNKQPVALNTEFVTQTLEIG